MRLREVTIARNDPQELLAVTRLFAVHYEQAFKNLLLI
jgi:hypothetical protein